MKRFISFWIVLQLFLMPVLADTVILGGDSIGIQIQFDGVLVTGTYEVNLDGVKYDPFTSDIVSGDLIQAVNDIPIATISDFSSILLDHINETVILKINRNEEILERKLEVRQQNGQIRSGLFVKDEILGIGTLTFIHPQMQSFASLGHEVLNSETQQLAPVGSGTLFKSQVIGIRKANVHQIGEKQARINFSAQIGSITKNNAFGIYGKTDQIAGMPTIETAEAHEVEIKEAIMYTVLENDEIHEVLIEITHINPQSAKDIKGFEFRIIDPHCLSLTNGIVQGMSGSPIVQNDKLIGAVTHVSGNDPAKGYGIYIEWMLEESKSDLYRQ